MPTLTELKKTRADLAAKMKCTEDEIALKLDKTVVQCLKNAAYGKGCGRKYFIKKIDFIQTHWYETPSGCSGGDMWHEGEGQWVCPSCEHLNRLYDKPEITALKSHFLSVVNQHRD